MMQKAAFILVLLLKAADIQLLLSGAIIGDGDRTPEIYAPL